LEQIDSLKKELAAIEGQPEPATPDTDIAHNDPDVLHLMRTVTGEDWLQYWPERANRSLAEAKHIVRLDRIARDKTNPYQDRQEAVQAITVIRKRLRGDRV
jgi:hypothetical protein